MPYTEHRLGKKEWKKAMIDFFISVLSGGQEGDVQQVSTARIAGDQSGQPWCVPGPGGLVSTGGSGGGFGLNGLSSYSYLTTTNCSF